MEFDEKNFLEEKGWLFNIKDPALLVRYLEVHYRESLWKELPVLIKSMEELFQDNSHNYPHLKEVQVHLNLVYTTLFRHLSDESVLFDALKTNNKVEEASAPMQSHSLKHLIGFMKYEHLIILEGLSRIRELCGNYEAPLHDCILFDLYLRLKRCENLLLEQIYLEDNLLFSLGPEKESFETG